LSALNNWLTYIVIDANTDADHPWLEEAKPKSRASMGCKKPQKLADVVTGTAHHCLQRIACALLSGLRSSHPLLFMWSTVDSMALRCLISALARRRNGASY